MNVCLLVTYCNFFYYTSIILIYRFKKSKITFRLVFGYNFLEFNCSFLRMKHMTFIAVMIRRHEAKSKDGWFN